MAQLATFIARHDKLAWDRQIEEDFAPGGRHEHTLAQIDAAIDAGDSPPFGSATIGSRSACSD